MEKCNATLYYSDNGLLAIVTCSIILGLGTAVGNFLVIASVYYFKRLRSLSNFFLVSLATADLIVGAITVPLYSLSAYDWPIVGTTVGQIYDFMAAVTLAASSFSLVTVTYDRHLAIYSPLRYRTVMTSHKCAMLVCIVWIFAFAVGIPNFATKNLRPRSIYLVVFVLISFLFPLIYITIAQIQIFKAVKRQLRFISENTSNDSLAVNGVSAKEQTRNRIILNVKMQPQCSSQETKLPPNSVRNSIQRETKSSDHEDADVSICAAVSINRNVKGQSLESRSSYKSVSTSNKKTTLCGCEFPTQNSQDGGPLEILQSNELSRDMVAETNKQILKRCKYSITMMIIIGCFALSWLPNFVLIIFQAASKDICTVVRYEQIYFVTLLISLVNSLLNPFIYCTRMRGFRIAFKTILKCKCRDNNERNDVTISNN